MDEIKTSALLTRLIENARRIGDKEDAPFTAEKLLVAIIDEIMIGYDKNANSEMSQLEDLMIDLFGNLNSARELLMAHILNDERTVYYESVFTNNKLRGTAKLVKANGGSEVDAVSFVRYFANAPDKAVASVMKNALEQSESARSSSDDGLVASDASAHARSVFSNIIFDIKRIRNVLNKNIYGQEKAVDVFTTGYFQASMISMIDRLRKRPCATFLFAGPPGVGKTYLAETAANALGLPFMRFDMSEYTDDLTAVQEICGYPKTYKSPTPGKVTDFVKNNPKCILLFDEIEKCCIEVIHLFLQLLDSGTLRDAYHAEDISFKDSIIIMTTNAGKKLYEDDSIADLSSVSRRVVIKALRDDINPKTGHPYFPAAICSRFASGNVVMFNRIDVQHLCFIAKKEIERQAENLKREAGIDVHVDEHVHTALLFSEGSMVDARTIKGRAETFFVDEFYELLRMIASGKVNTSIDDIETIRVSVDLSGTNADIRELFVSADRTKVLLFTGEEMISACRDKVHNIDFIGVQTLDDAIETIKSQDIDFVLLDMKYSVPEESSVNLNIEDVDSPTRNFFKFLKEQRNDLPIYLAEDCETALSEEEMVSFVRQGVRGFVYLDQEDDALSARLGNIASMLHQQASMTKLARINKRIVFETAQTISGDGKNAEIRLFDFSMNVDVDSEDSKNILSAVSRPNVHFTDVIGANDAKKELTDFVNYLKNPKKYMGTGVKAPKGVLLYGPPGTGKTMLAKAIAREADVTFIAAEGNQFVTKYVGEGAEKVHELFRTARKYAPAVFFIDEIDAIARERKGGSGASANSEETLTAFLTEMDGFASDPARPVFVLAATNFDVEPGHDKSLDPALMRRFDRRVYIDLPNKEDRVRFLKMKVAKNRALDISEEQINNISVRSTGMSLAELDLVVEFALRSAIREGSTVVTDPILEEAFETFNGGEAKKWDSDQLERVARHEAGHAFICRQSGETPSYITIVARGNHGGYMQHAEQEGKAIYTKAELLARIRTALGGRAAEIAYYGKDNGVSTGASGDLTTATNIARQIVCSYGMDDEFGIAVVNSSAIDGAMSSEVRAHVNRILKEQMDEAVILISANKEKIDSLVNELLAKNHLSGTEIEQAINRAGGNA